MVDVQKLYRKLYALGAIKGAARDAIVEKEGTLDEDAPFREYPAGIRSIPKGGGPAGAFVVPDGMCFAYSHGIQEFPENWDFSQVFFGENLFMECSALRTAPEVTIHSGYHTCSGCISLVDASKVHHLEGGLSYTFSSCRALKYLAPITITDSITKTGQTTSPSIGGAFQGCSELEEITLHIGQIDSDWELISVGGVFTNCTKLARINFSFESNQKLTYAFSNCFSGCDALTELPASLFEFANSFSGKGAIPPNLRAIPAFDATKMIGVFTVAKDGTLVRALTDIGQITNLCPQSIQLAGCNNITLASMINLVNGLLPVDVARRIKLEADVLARMQADTATYTWNGQTYTGIIALANAKGWTVTS